MRGFGQDMSIGQRVAWYRNRRGLTQEVLAGMVSRTTDWLSKVENDRANLERLSVIKALADALDVTVGDLLGEPSLQEWSAATPDRAYNSLREALMSYSALTSPSAGTGPFTPEQLRAQVDDAWSAYQASRFGYVTIRLPQILGSARTASKDAESAEDRRQAQRMLALGYHAASATLTKVGEADLAWIAADRGLSAAEETGDAAVIASLLRSAAHALLANGRYDAAMDVVSRSVTRLGDEEMSGADLRWSLLGSLHLVGAMAAARADAPREARTFLARARQAGQQLGHDGNHGWTSFGPTNVAVHDLSVAVELGDLQTAASIAPRVDARALPVERRVRHALEVAKVYSLTGRRDDALGVVLHAEQDAPEQVRHHYIARELVIGWLRLSPAPSPALASLGQRLRVA